MELAILAGGDHGADAVEEVGIETDVIADLVDGAIHEIGGGDIKLPEVFCFPGSEGVGADGLDVGKGQQGEHLEHLGVADLIGEGANIFRIKYVAAQGVGHFDVKANEVEDGLSFFSVKVQPCEEGVGQFDAGGDVVAGAACLAGVVKHESEEKKVEALDFRH